MGEGGGDARWKNIYIYIRGKREARVNFYVKYASTGREAHTCSNFVRVTP